MIWHRKKQFISLHTGAEKLSVGCTDVNTFAAEFIYEVAKFLAQLAYMAKWKLYKLKECYPCKESTLKIWQDKYKNKHKMWDQKFR